MFVRIVCVGLAALVVSACEHPFADAALQGPRPAGSGPAAAAGDARLVLTARSNLQALLLQHAADGVLKGSLPDAKTGTPSRALASPSWLEENSAALRMLVERSRAAHHANAAAGG